MRLVPMGKVNNKSQGCIYLVEQHLKVYLPPVCSMELGPKSVSCYGEEHVALKTPFRIAMFLVYQGNL